MKQKLKMMVLTFATMVAAAAFGADEGPTVTEATAKQRYPWNGLVDITCKVTGIDGTTNGLKLAVSAIMPDTGKARSLTQFWVVQGGTNTTDREVHVNGDYQLLWDARAEFGHVRYTNMALRVTFDSHGKVQLWKGGPYWAETNIGAENPEDYGYYFWWGDTVGYKREGDAWVASDGSTSSFSFFDVNTPTYHKSYSTLQSEGWVTSDGVLAPEHDAAHVHWGGEWRMPTWQEFIDLVDNCVWTWTTQNGVNGYIVRGRGEYSSASIFLPASGDGYGTSLNGVGSYSYYWSSVPYSDYAYSDYDYSAWSLYFYSSGRLGTDGDGYRFHGRPVRPLQGFTK